MVRGNRVKEVAFLVVVSSAIELVRIFKNGHDGASDQVCGAIHGYSSNGVAFLVAAVSSAIPLVAFLYELLVWATYSFYREISWTRRSALVGLLLRSIVVALSWYLVSAITFRFCDNGDIQTGVELLYMIAGFAYLGVYLLRKTRQDEVVGIDNVPFYGSRALEGKVMAITGANNGIGFESTRQLAAQGATILMLCRNPKRAYQAIKDIRELQIRKHAEDPKKYPTKAIAKEQLIFIPFDLSDISSIRSATTMIEQLMESRAAEKELPRDSCVLDALICNAGLMLGTQSTTKDGLETMMQSNHLGHFLLIKLMLEKGMLRTKIFEEPSRVCLLTSSTYLFAASQKGFDFSDPYCSKGLRKYSLFGQYSMTKLANLLTAKELARRYNPRESSNLEKSLAVFAVHPGIVRTNVTTNMTWIYQLFLRYTSRIVHSIQKTAEEGAYTTVFTVSAPLESISSWNRGCYFVNCQKRETNDYVEGPRGSEDATRLWEWSEEQLLQLDGKRGAATNANNGINGSSSYGAIDRKKSQ